MLKKLDLRDDAPWKQRFRAAQMFGFGIATQQPTHGFVCTNKDGIYQLYAWDVTHGDLRQLTHQSGGILFGAIAADGKAVYYLNDQDGNELGHFVKVPFEGGDPIDLTPTMPNYASWYITESADGSTVGFTAAAKEWGFRIYVQNQAGDILFTYENSALSVGPNLSYDGTIAVIATTERSNNADNLLEAYDVQTSRKLGELYDGDGINFDPIGFVPRADDERYLATSNQSGYTRPLIWHPRTGERHDLQLEGLDGDITPHDWSDDGRTILLLQWHQAVSRLYRYDLETDQVTALQHPDGSFILGHFMPDNKICIAMQNSQHPSRIVALDWSGKLIGTLLGVDDAPLGHTWRSVTVTSADDTPVQGWLATPEGAAPYPTIVHTHGGPTSVLTQGYKPDFDAWLDHGFAVFSINYRGSLTFGKDFRNAINGNLGELEVQDVQAGVQWLIDQGMAIPDQIFKTGVSYGGYLTLLALGKTPQLWAGGMAVVAVADWTLMYEDQAETLRGYQRSLFGGTPDDMPDQMAKSSPITYVEQVTAPIQVIQGENDTRCPARQMRAYATKMTEHGKAFEIMWFDTGHGALPNDVYIAHQEAQMRFAYRVLGQAE